MKTPQRARNIRRAVLALVSASALLLGGRKTIELSADPTGEKDCPPIPPETAGEPATTAQLQVAEQASLPWIQKGGTINDASCLNRTSIYGAVRVTKEEDVRDALVFAKQQSVGVSVAAVRHSMGGQAFRKNAVVLDMRGFNKMSLDADNKILTVQSGATWHSVQSFLHPRLAVKSMQSSDIFSVGGSISVNAHGMDHQAGSVAQSVRSMRVMLPDGTIKTASRTENLDLFNHVLGGYGLFGVVLDAQIDVVDNVVYETGRQVIDYKQFTTVFNDQLIKNEKLGLMYGHLSTSPDSFLKEMILYTYVEAGPATADAPPLGEVTATKMRRLVLNFSKMGGMAMRIKWFAEKYIEPKLETCTITRSQAMTAGEACLVSRNEPMHDSVPYLKNSLPGETDILQEYYIPREQFETWVDRARDIMTADGTNLLNASVRIVHKEDIALTYAPQDMFSIVLYINQDTTAEGNDKMRKLTGELIDLTQSVNGRFFLPYQLYYTPQQLKSAYPEIEAFFAAKKTYDPDLLLRNTFYDKYAGASN